MQGIIVVGRKIDDIPTRLQPRGWIVYQLCSDVLPQKVVHDNQRFHSTMSSHMTNTQCI
jgi:hypothetical protein